MTAWVGLTGGIGSGKSQAAAEFARLGVPVIDADAISRSLSADNGAALPAILATFGASVFHEPGRLNRAALRDLVFRRPEEKARLEAVMFPLIIEAIRQQQQRHSEAVYGILDIPLLVEEPLFRTLVQRVLVIDAPEAVQITRVAQRSGLSEAEIKRIMAAQAGRRQRCRAADDVIGNEVSLEMLAAKAERLHRYYRALFSRPTRVCP